MERANPAQERGDGFRTGTAGNANINLAKKFIIGIDGLPTADGGIRSVMDGRLSFT